MIPRKSAHVLSWVVLLLCCASVIGYDRLCRPRTAAAAAAAAEGAADYFLLVRMPEITSQYESGVATMKQRMDEWLERLAAEGFRPMLLTEAMRRIREKKGVPERTVVLMFSPGYRRTYEIVSPILDRHRCPAVYLTDRSAMERLNRRYLTFHTTHLMRDSGLWDVGFVDRRGRFGIVGGGAKKKPVVASCWSIAAGALALNRERDFERLNYLTVNADWNAEELVSRLRAECPANGAVLLGKAAIHSREWGVTLPGTDAAASFDLRAPVNKRGTKLFWLGTLGRPEYRLDLTVGSLRGGLWLQLGLNEDTGDNVHVVMDGTNLLVEEQRDRCLRQLLTVPVDRSFNERPFALGVTRRGRSVTVSVDGKTFSTQSSAEDGGNGFIQLYLADRLRGIARADAIRLCYSSGNGE